MMQRVFISHTSEFATYPKEMSFVDAAKAAVNRAGCVPCEMDYFTARDQQPAQYCIDRVRACDVCVGIIGLRYGSPVRDRPEISYTELEFEAASLAPHKTRLMFLLDPNALVPLRQFTDLIYGERQDAFRQRLHDAGVMCRLFSNVHELETLIYQALMEEIPPTLGASLSPSRIRWEEGESPYPGLFSFNLKYAPLFFGRDREVNEIVAKMSEPEGRVVIISGSSGSGKSSLVAAGLRRALLEHERLPHSKQWVWLCIRPGFGQRPFESLAWGLTQVFQVLTRPVELATKLSDNTRTMADVLVAHLTGKQELVLFVDQLEELFTRGFNSEDIICFLDRLVTTAHDRRSRLRVIATVRSEFISRLEEVESVLRILNGYNYHLGPVSPRMLQDIIEKPATTTGYEFESGLVEEILRDTEKEPGSLPLVAYAMNQLFLQLKDQSRTFTRQAYETIGQVAGSIGTQADRVLQCLEVDSAFDRVFAELVLVERDRPASRKRASLSQFTGDEQAGKIIQVLSGQDCRVLVTAGEGQGATVEVAHEKLFSVWPKLKDWIDKSGEALRLIKHAEEAARRWEDSAESPQELWIGARINEVLVALQRFGKRPSPALSRFVRPQHLLLGQLLNPTLSHGLRQQCGRILREFGDPRAGVGLRPDGLPDIVWIDIPEGQVKLEEVDRVFEISPFRIAKYPVTNIQFEAFLTAEDGHRNEKWWGDIEQSHEVPQPSWREANAPRETVSWYEAIAFCRWLSDKTKTSIRLPTEWEWQQAATGGDSEREYPWKGKWDESCCNGKKSRLNQTTTVGMYPQGATQQGVHDMAGNVWEWCLNTYEQPNILVTAGGGRVIRGGSWYHFDPDYLRTSLRHWSDVGNRFFYIGFRLAQDIQ